jgi:hypothetical protein
VALVAPKTRVPPEQRGPRGETYRWPTIGWASIVGECLPRATPILVATVVVDGLAGTEGTFLLCTFWLAEALARAGKVERAREVFERAIAFANDVGLLSEVVVVKTGELLGNFPQAFSHIGLINAAWAISQAETRVAVEGGGAGAGSV